MNRKLPLFVAVPALVSVAVFAVATPQATAKPPVMDGGAGPCSVELTVKGPDRKPVYDATVKVHIAYGFAGAHRLDLQAGTDADGKVKFTGIPARVHRPPLEFEVSKGKLQATLDYDPSAECSAKHEVTLQKASPQPSQQ
jgi:hypothetical protein